MLTSQWFVGFFDGEGTFDINIQKRKDSTYTYHPRLRISQANLELIKNLQAFLGCGSITEKKTLGYYIWELHIRSKADLRYKILPIFDAFPPNAKAKEYPIWREAVLYYCHFGNYRERHKERLKQLAEQLTQSRLKPMPPGKD